MTLSCDVLVIGSGAGGLCTAVTAAHLGLDVIVIEKEPVFGGTTAWSGGWMWVPRNHLSNINESIDAPRDYLKKHLGNYHAATVDNFLENAPKASKFFEENTELKFIDGNLIPDFHGDAPAARSLCAAPYDARLLGNRLKDLRPPLEMIAPWGMGIAAGVDIRAFLSATYKWASFKHVSWTRNAARKWQCDDCAAVKILRYFGRSAFYKHFRHGIDC
jgi:phytoene dehydrogenase-like protein